MKVTPFVTTFLSLRQHTCDSHNFTRSEHIKPGEGMKKPRESRPYVISEQNSRRDLFRSRLAIYGHYFQRDLVALLCGKTKLFGSGGEKLIRLHFQGRWTNIMKVTVQRPPAIKGQERAKVKSGLSHETSLQRIIGPVNHIAN